MTKPKKRPQPKKRNRFTFKPGNKFAFKPKAERDALPIEQPSGTEITPSQLVRITDLVAQGWRAPDMRFAVNMPPAVWDAYCATHPEVAEAIAKGECQLHNKVFAGQLKKSRKGDFMASALIMNGRFGYRDPDGDSGGAKVMVNIVNLPGASKQPVIEGEFFPDPSGNGSDDSDIVEIREIPPAKPNGGTDPTPTQHAPVERPRTHAANAGGTTAPPKARQPATHRKVGAASVALTMQERLIQERAIAAGRPDPYAPADTESPPDPPSRPQTAAERAAVRDFESAIGINSIDPTRADFPSDAAWARWNKRR
jgi:hypothetical protein